MGGVLFKQTGNWCLSTDCRWCLRRSPVIASGQVLQWVWLNLLSFIFGKRQLAEVFTVVPHAQRVCLQSHLFLKTSKGSCWQWSGLQFCCLPALRRLSASRLKETAFEFVRPDFLGKFLAMEMVTSWNKKSSLRDEEPNSYCCCYF